MCNLFLSEYYSGWRICLWLQCGASGVLLLGAPFLPETPRYLVSRGDTAQA